MHDPMSVAFEINYPWKTKGTHPYHAPFITIWHNDPCKDGTDNSCDWWGVKRKLNAQEKQLYHAIDDLLHTLGNRPYYPDTRLYGTNPHGIEPDADRGVIGRVNSAMYEWKRKRGFRIHPRWHIWHWSFQIHPLQTFKRWAFSRCSKCKKGFAWGYSPSSNSWVGTGPLWFRSERDVFHNDCTRPTAYNVVEAQVSR